MLLGPILLFLGSAFLAPDLNGDRLNLRQHYYSARPIYATLLGLVWTWALLSSPIYRGALSDSAPVLAMFLVVALLQRLTARDLLHRVAAVLNWLLLLTFVLSFGRELGGMAPILDLNL
jgi:hypothetical protein